MSNGFMRSKRLALALAGGGLLLPAANARAADGTWTSNAAGNWSDTARWLGGTVADGADALADFSTIEITGNRTVTIDGASPFTRTIGRLRFEDITPTHVYTIAAPAGNTLLLDTTTAVQPNIETVTGNHFITAVVTGDQGFSKSGEGQIRLNQANTFTGPINVSAGTVRTNNLLGFNHQAITITGNGAAYLDAAGDFNSTFGIQGEGPLEPGSTTRLGAIRFGTGGATITNTVTLTGPAAITGRGTVAAGGGTITGQITGTHPLRLGRSSTTAGGGADGLITISNPLNNWSGVTTIEDGTLRLGASEVIPNGPAADNVIMHNGGTSVNATIFDTVLALNGFNETINGLSHSPGADLTKLRISNGAATNSVLTVGSNGASGDFGGILQNGAGGGTLGLTKIGAGTQFLRGDNTYTGDTTVQGGTLALGSATSANNLAASPRLVVGDSPANSLAGLDVTGITAPGGFTLPSGQTLLGHGTVTGAVTVGAGATIDPGNGGIGTLTRSGNTTLAGLLNVDLDAAGPVDLLDNTVGLLDISAGTVDFDVVGTPAQGGVRVREVRLARRHQLRHGAGPAGRVRDQLQLPGPEPDRAGGGPRAGRLRAAAVRRRPGPAVPPPPPRGLKRNFAPPPPRRGGRQKQRGITDALSVMPLSS